MSHDHSENATVTATALEQSPAKLHLIFRPQDREIVQALEAEARFERRSKNVMAQILMEEALAARRLRRNCPEAAGH